MFLLSVLPGLGLFWILKHNTKINFFKNSSFFFKSLLILNLANAVFLGYSIIQTLLWFSLVSNNIRDEQNEGSLDGVLVEKNIAENYNLFFSIVLFISVCLFILIFVKGFIKRKKNKNLKSQQIFENKSSLLLKIILFLSLFLTTIFSMFMLVLASNFIVYY